MSMGYTLDDVTDGIINSRFTPFYGFHCNFCDYQVPCEDYSVSHGGPKISIEDRIKDAKEVTWDDDFERFKTGKQEPANQDSEQRPPIYASERNGQLALQFGPNPSYKQGIIKWKKQSLTKQ